MARSVERTVRESCLSEGSREERGHNGQLRVQQASLPSEYGCKLQSTHPAKAGGEFAALRKRKPKSDDKQSQADVPVDESRTLVT